MADLANAAILASLVVGMASIPAASGTIDGSSNIPDPVDNISSSRSVPSEESTELGPGMFRRTVDTAFSSFATTIESGVVEGELETPQSDLTLRKGSGSVTWILETPQGRLEITRDPTEVTETTETPMGTLTKTRENGRQTVRFTGSNREAVEETHSELRDLMREMKQKYMQKSDRMRARQYEQGIELDVAPESPEKVVVTNSMDRSIDLHGWRIENNNPDGFELETGLEPGQTLHFYSADEEEVEVDENDGDVYRYGAGIAWENGGDTATLFDSQGQKVESYTY